MKKYYVLDTNVLLHDVNSLFAFQDNDVVIPIIAIEELDRFKKDLNEIGRNARQVSRILDKFRDQGQLFKGIKLENGGTLRVFIQSSKSNSLPPELIFNKADNQILSVAMELKEKGKQPVCLVTKDTNLRIKADALGISARDYESDKIEISELYEGFRTITVSKAGTGKTLVAIAAGLKKTADEETYTRLLVSRPIFPLGKDIGFLPGELEEKLKPWMQPIFDNLELIFGMEKKEKGGQRNYRELMNQ